MSQGLPSDPDPIRFDEAVRAFSGKLIVTRAQWDAMTIEARRKAFMVSGVAKLDVIKHVHEQAIRAAKEGIGLKDFRKQVKDQLAAQWQGSVKNPAWRIEVIYRNAVNTAYNAGRHEQMTDPVVMAVRPFWMMSVMQDERTFEICFPLAGVVLPATDPWWKSHWPPLHHACRTSVRCLRTEQAKKQRKFGDPPPVHDSQEGFGGIPGQNDWQPKAADYPPGWGSKVEQLKYDASKQSTPLEPPREMQFSEEPQQAAPAKVPPPPAPSDAVSYGSIGKADEARVKSALAAIEKSHGGKPLVGVEVNSGDLQPTHKGMMGAHCALKDGSFKIVMEETGNAKELDFAHEFGHHVDKSTLKLTSKSGGWDKDAAKMPEIKALRKAINESDAYKQIQEIYSKRGVDNPALGARLEYMSQPDELFARAYAQYVAKKSGDHNLLSQLAARREHVKGQLYLPTQWDDKDFEPIAKSMDELFEARGWKVAPKTPVVPPSATKQIPPTPVVPVPKDGVKAFNAKEWSGNVPMREGKYDTPKGTMNGALTPVINATAGVDKTRIDQARKAIESKRPIPPIVIKADPKTGEKVVKSGHYFLFALAGMSLLTAVVIWRLGRLSKAEKKDRLPAAVPGPVVVRYDESQPHPYEEAA